MHSKVAVVFDAAILFYNNMNPTEQYNNVISICRKTFADKTHDYGLSWKIMRPKSLTDQIYIKALRIRTLEETTAKVNEGIQPELVAIINYSVMAILALKGAEITPKNVFALYDTETDNARALMQIKNHDYGEAWRNLRTTSITDLILMKLLRIRQIEDNEGQTLASEGVDAGYTDIINYAVFSLILSSEKQTNIAA